MENSAEGLGKPLWELGCLPVGQTAGKCMGAPISTECQETQGKGAHGGLATQTRICPEFLTTTQGLPKREGHVS